MDEVHWWNLILSAISGLVMYLLKSHSDEVKRVSKLLNQTREQVARDTISRTEASAAFKELQIRIDHLGDRLSDKIDSNNSRSGGGK